MIRLHRSGCQRLWRRRDRKLNCSTSYALLAYSRERCLVLQFIGTSGRRLGRVGAIRALDRRHAVFEI